MAIQGDLGNQPSARRSFPAESPCEEGICAETLNAPDGGDATNRPKLLHLMNLQAGIQTLVGYLAAAIGLLVELAIASKFGANAKTDMFRWMALILYYVNYIIAAVVVPVIFYVRPPPSSNSPKISGTRTLVVRAAPTPYAHLLVPIGIAMCFVIVYAIRDPVIGVLNCVLGIAMLALSIRVLPLFYFGFTWINNAVTLLVNVVCLSFFVLGSDMYADLVGSLVLSIVIILCVPSILHRIVHFCAREQFARFSATYEKQPEFTTQNSGGFPLVLATLLGLVISLIYYWGLSRRGGGLLSLYAFASKAGVLLSVPALTLVNSWTRDRHSVGRSGPAIFQVMRQAWPVLAVSPFFAVFCFSLACAVYSFDPSSHQGRMIAFACVGTTFATSLNLAYSMVCVGRGVGPYLLVPAIVSLVIAVVLGAIVTPHLQTEQALFIPSLGTMSGAVIALVWVAIRNGEPISPILFHAACAFGLLCVMSVIIDRDPLLAIPDTAVWLARVARHWLG